MQLLRQSPITSIWFHTPLTIAMASDLWSIFLNLIAAFVYAGLVWLWKNRLRNPQSIESVPPPQREAPAAQSDDSGHREANRRKVESIAFGFMFYLVTFMALYFSITMPALFKALFSKQPVLLSQAREIGEYLPDLPVGKDLLQLAFFLVAAVIYLPLLLLANFVFSMIYPLINAFTVVTSRKVYSFTMVAFLLLCIPIAATSVWFFYAKTFSDSLTTVLMFLGVTFALGQAQGQRS